ncbi:hypothetical protein [Natrialba sp. INN-245]|uniref:hypothetical protein n=1 Tax=Natrialba sp. INN-245 TaxID=2690967 RepID=UPI0013119CB9|nr:hypothetical protein [Natrialba sp. INN-245]MWV39804.1 hypothetical protein [Natrialba sp. INN-245]
MQHLIKTRYAPRTRVDTDALVSTHRSVHGYPITYLGGVLAGIVPLSLFLFGGGWFVSLGFAGLVGACRLIGERVEVDGWYVRQHSPLLAVRRLEGDVRSQNGYIHLGRYVRGILALLRGLQFSALAS